MKSLIVLLLLPRMDYSGATLADPPRQLLDILQSVMNAAARLVFSVRKYDHFNSAHVLLVNDSLHKETIAYVLVRDLQTKILLGGSVVKNSRTRKLATVFVHYSQAERHSSSVRSNLRNAR